MIIHRKALTLAILAAMAGTTAASEAPVTLEEMVVTGVRTDAPLNVSTNPKAPRQPVPAGQTPHDQASRRPRACPCRSTPHTPRPAP